MQYVYIYIHTHTYSKTSIIRHAAWDRDMSRWLRKMIDCDLLWHIILAFIFIIKHNARVLSMFNL